MKLQPYRSYRPSGVDWIGVVPKHWTVVDVKRRYDIQLGKMLQRRPTSVNDVKVPYFKARHVQWFDVEPTSSRMWASPADVDRVKVVPGDLLVCEGGEGGRCAILLGCGNVDHIIQNALHRVRPRCRDSNKFLRYVLRAVASAGWLERIHDKATIAHLTREKLGALRIPRATPSEQAAIGRFLDGTDVRIRRYIRAMERLINLVEEQKQAIIHQAVTGQIDVRTGQPYRAYKDSGVEWLGGIPAHWERCRLRNVVSGVTTGSRGWSRYAADTGPLFVRVANLSRGSLQLRFDDIVRLDLPTTSEAARTRISEGDLLVSVTAYIGSVGVAPAGFEEAYVSQHVARCEPLTGMSAKWLGYVLLSEVGQIHGQMSLYGGTKDGLSLDDVKNYPVLVPPRDEQAGLVLWIERQMSVLGELLDGANRQIGLVREYRTRLIADVVTGKLDVREAAAWEPNVDPLPAPDTGDETLEVPADPHAAEPVPAMQPPHP